MFARSIHNSRSDARSRFVAEAVSVVAGATSPHPAAPAIRLSCEFAELMGVGLDALGDQRAPEGVVLHVASKDRVCAARAIS